MEFAPAAQRSTGINFASFNQDFRSFSLATKQGWVVHSTESGAKIHENRNILSSPPFKSVEYILIF